MEIIVLIIVGSIIIFLSIAACINFIPNNFVLKRFWKKLEKVAEEEEITVSIHENIKLLNDHCYGEGYTDQMILENKTGELACGVYRYNEAQTIKDIHLCKGAAGDVWTFAHEIGHHFSIKYHGDKSEEAADNYRRVLVKNYMPFWHRWLIPIDISVYAPKKEK